MSFPCDHEIITGDRIYVYFCPEKTVSKQSMKTLAISSIYIHRKELIGQDDRCDG